MKVAFTILILLLLLASSAFAMWGRGLATQHVGPPPPPVNFVSVSISCAPFCAYASGATSGTVIGNLSAVMSSGSFTGTWSTSGTDAADFSANVGNQLKTNGTTPTCTSTTTFHLNIVATQAGVTNSPFPQAITVVCNPPGGGATPPTQATVAGFNTAIIDSDFTSAAYANTSTWLDCAGANPYIWFYGGGFPPGNNACPTIGNDPGGGGQVLQITYTPSSSGGPNGITSHITFPATSVYTEGVMRVAGMNQANAFWDAPWTAAFNGCSLEFDSFEDGGPYTDGSNGTDAAYHNCGMSGPNFPHGLWFDVPIPNPPPGYDVSQYHTYGMRVNTDTSTGIEQCIWIDNRFQACQTIHATEDGTTTAQISTTPGLVNLIGNTTTQLGGPITSTITTYVKRVTAWSCPSWQSSNQVACATSVIDPGGY
jgi:hypothetical protein